MEDDGEDEEDEEDEAEEQDAAAAAATPSAVVLSPILLRPRFVFLAFVVAKEGGSLFSFSFSSVVCCV